MTTHRYRRASAFGLAVAMVAAGSVVLMPPAQAAVTTINPFAGGEGFTVVALGDAELGNGEIEGSIAVTGTISAAKENYPIRHQAAGSGDYTIPVVDGMPTRVLAGAFGGAAGTGLAITNQNAPDDANRGIAKIVSTSGLQAGGRGSWTRVVAEKGAYIDVEALPFADSVSSLEALKTERDSVSAYLDVPHYDVAQRCLADGYASAVAVDAADQLMHIVSPNRDGGMALPGPFASDKPNVFEYADFVTANPIKPDNLGGWTPSAQAPLIIRIPAGTTTVQSILIEGWSPSVEQQQDYAQYVMYDLSAVAGDVTIDGVEIGAIFAPNADVTFTGSRTQNGQWVTQDLTTQGGGEIHHYAFRGQIPCDLAEDADADADGADTDATDADTDADGTDAGADADADADGTDADADADGVDADAADADADAADADADATDGADVDGDADATDGVDVDAADADADGADADADTDATDGADADADGADAAADATDGADAGLDTAGNTGLAGVSGTDSGLAVTGSSIPVSSLVGGAALLLGGLVLGFLTRARRRA